jgi:hypothetical protein
MSDDTTLREFGLLFAGAFAVGLARGAAHKHGLPYIPLEGLVAFAGTAVVAAPIGGKIVADKPYGFLHHVGSVVGAGGAYVAEEVGNFLGYLAA